jgi:hypothetical protein
MIKKLEIQEKKLNLKTKILVFLFLFLIFEYLNYKFWSNYTVQSPILIKFQSPIIKKNKTSNNKQTNNTPLKSPKISVFGQVREEKEFRPELEAIYIYFGKDITAYAIAMAESGLNCKRKSNTSDYGLMQIHLPLHQWRFDRFGGKWDDCWDNVKVAYEIYKEQKWQPWSVYKNKRYLDYLEQAKLLVKNYFKNK